MSTQSQPIVQNVMVNEETTLQFTPISVELVDHMGSDLSVVNAARVSFAKESLWIDGQFNNLSVRDQKLIEYLATHNHWSPFGHAFASFRIKAPIGCARQLSKSTVGLCWNEVSRRYVSYEPEVYAVESWRGAPVNAKQGSDGVPTLGQEAVAAMYTQVTTQAVEAYNALIAGGVAPEQARLILPQGMMTEWIWSGSLAAFARIAKLRLAPDTQKETREVAHGIAVEMERLFPVSFKALVAIWKA
ncbi:MAG: thymidylate synthase [Candidatus Dependentiae bacterium]|nr:thymidylate synthase [Candidatus Dependentiae bacterium]